MSGRKRKTQNLRCRRGSYLVEASLTLPVFILGVIALAMIVNLIAVCETICYVMSRELKEHQIVNAGILNTVSLCRTIENGVKEQHPNLMEFHVKKTRSGVQSGGMTDLIAVTSQADFQVLFQAGIGGAASFEQKLMARSFTGAEQEVNQLDTADFTQNRSAQSVLVYPKYGQRFHVESCAIVRQQKENDNAGWTMDLAEAELRAFTPCEICGGGTA